MKRVAPRERRVVGWREWVGLPALGISHIKAKLDTGARTSALHAFDIEGFRRGGADWIRFNIHPAQRDESLAVPCEAKVADRRHVVNSGGERELRYVISTDLRLGEDVWPIELTLTNRDEMGFRMLIGRSAMHRRLIVDPARSFQATRTRRRTKASVRLDRTAGDLADAPRIVAATDEEE